MTVLPTLPAALQAAALPLTADALEFYARDVYRAGQRPLAVVRPADREALRALAGEATRAGFAIVVRGGGASYTDAHLPSEAASILVDTSALDRILEIDEANMLVVVEPGVSWAKLDGALAPKGLKVPFIGTFSGLAATVGGTLSQNANGLGSNAAGISTDSVVALEVVTADGGVLRTATAGAFEQSSWFRNYGPDLTGLFLGDCGALGIKSAIVLKLLRRRPAAETASFAFADFDAMHACMAAVAAGKLDDKGFGLDQALQRGQIARQDTSSLAALAAGVWRSTPGVWSGARSLARLAAAGTKPLAAAPYAAHYIVEGHSPTEARARIATLRALATHFGHEIANSVPTVVHANPFQPLRNLLGPAGERWVPLHGLLPHSRVLRFHAAFRELIASRRAEMESHHVHIGAMFSCLGASTFLYEPALYWRDALTVYHERMMEPDYLASLPRYAPNPAGAALVEDLRTTIITLMHAHGAAHLQIGKLYPYLDGRDPLAVELLRAIKRALDPQNRMNPGALGL